MQIFPSSINWDEVAALTALSTTATGALGVALSFYIRTIISKDVEERLKAHTEAVLAPMIAEIGKIRQEQVNVALELARSDERMKYHERLLSVDLRPAQSGLEL